MTTQDDPTRLALTLEIKIRTATKQDLPLLEWNGQYTHFRRIFRRAYREQCRGKRLMLVADKGGFPIARLFILYEGKNRSLANGYSRGYIYSFHVMEAFQSHGIGSRMMQVAEDILRQRRFHIVTLAVAKVNERALRLYERRGYQIMDDDEGKWRYQDHKGRVQYVHEPCWLLEKQLIERK